MLNGFSRSLIGSDVVYTEQQRDADVSAINEKIASLQRQQSEEGSSSQAAIAEAQRQYDTFCARVPW